VRAAYEIEKSVVDQIVANQGIDSVPIASALLLGATQVRLEETAAGLVWMQRAAADAETQGFRVGQIGALVYGARAELLLGRTEGIKEKLDQAERMSRENPQAYARPLLAIHQVRALWLLQRKDPSAALAELGILLTALDYPRKLDSDRLAPALVARANALLALDRQTEALKDAKQALEVAEKLARRPEQSADVGAALLAMAEAQHALGLTDMRASAERAVVALTNSLGAGHSKTRKAAAIR